jgi:hypothetical protein
VEEVQKFEGMLDEKLEETKSREEEYAELMKTKVEVERDYELAKINKNQILKENEEINRTKS